MKHFFLFAVVASAAAQAQVTEYSAPFSSVASITVTAGTHGLGANDKISVRSCYSTSLAYQLVKGSDYTWSTADNGDITISGLTGFGTGTCRIVSAMAQRQTAGLTPEFFTPALLTDAAGQTVTFGITLPATWDSSTPITINGVWSGLGAGGNMVLGGRAKCAASLSAVLTGWTEPVEYPLDPVTSAIVPINISTLNSIRTVVTPVGCTPGQRAFLQLVRNGADVLDNSTDTLKLQIASYEFMTLERVY